jgi:hypothetical protein
MLILLACGSALGIALGIAASRLLSAIVYEASAQDPFVLACVAATIDERCTSIRRSCSANNSRGGYQFSEGLSE